MCLTTVIAYLLHQDWWNWRESNPLVFGFLPIGLAYHAFYTLVVAGWMAVLARWAPPADLFADDGEAGNSK